MPNFIVVTAYEHIEPMILLIHDGNLALQILLENVQGGYKTTVKMLRADVSERHEVSWTPKGNFRFTHEAAR